MAAGEGGEWAKRRLWLERLFLLSGGVGESPAALCGKVVLEAVDFSVVEMSNEAIFATDSKKGRWCKEQEGRKRRDYGSICRTP